MCPLKYVTDLDFAHDITLLSGTMTNAQSSTAVKENAAVVGLHINMNKTEYIGDFSSDNHPTLTVTGGEIAEVRDFCCLSSWTRSSKNNFSVRHACAYEAVNRL